jgi:hypothetical protein
LLVASSVPAQNAYAATNLLAPYYQYLGHGDHPSVWVDAGRIYSTADKFDSAVQEVHVLKWSSDGTLQSEYVKNSN